MLLAVPMAVALAKGTPLGEVVAVTAGVAVGVDMDAVGETVAQNSPATGLAMAISSPISA
jgi:hypothetical protein